MQSSLYLMAPTLCMNLLASQATRLTSKLIPFLESSKLLVQCVFPSTDIGCSEKKCAIGTQSTERVTHQKSVTMKAPANKEKGKAELPLSLYTAVLLQ